MAKPTAAESLDQTTSEHAEANAVLRRWNSLADWQKAGVVAGGTAVVVATGGAAAWAIATVGDTVTIQAGGTVVTVAGGAASNILARRK